MILAAALATMVAGAPAHAAGGRVAVSLAISSDDAVQRDIAAAVVQSARDSWDLEAEPLDGTACKAGDVACVRVLAARRGAGFVLVVGVAPLGVRDHVLAVQLFDVQKTAPLFEESAVQSGGDEKKSQVRTLTTHLVAVAGPPPKPLERQAAPAPVAPTPPPTGAWSVVGTGLVVAGLVGGGVTAIVAAVFAAQHQPEDAGTTGVIGVAASGALISSGAIALMLDGG